jgi:hypothetical protein
MPEDKIWIFRDMGSAGPSYFVKAPTKRDAMYVLETELNQVSGVCDEAVNWRGMDYDDSPFLGGMDVVRFRLGDTTSTRSYRVSVHPDTTKLIKI